MDPLELGTVAAIVLVFFLWGPQKIPEMARMVAQARKELDKATREFQNVSAGIQNGTSPFFASSTTPPPPPQAAPLPQPSQQGVRALPEPPAPTSSVKTGDQLLIEAARRLGINTQGKTREQVQLAIIAMAQQQQQPQQQPQQQQPPTSTEGPPPPSGTGDPAA